MQPDDFAAMVVLTVKTAMAPVLERLATAEQCNKELQARVVELGGLRDRVTTIETKAVLLPLPPPEPLTPTPTVDLAPVLERVAGLEARLVPLGDVRDRLIAVETKSAQPLPPLERPVDLAPVLSSIAELAKDAGTMRERIAVVETRAPIPGPNGKDGANGQNGKDGADGLGWDDLSVEHDGERAFTIKMMRGDRVKDAGSFTVPVQIYRGVYAEGRTYEPGDTVTYARSLWHCRKTTVLRPDGVTRDPVTGESKGAQGKDFWTLVAKGGADGKDGRDAAPPIPVVSVGGTR